MGEVIIFEVTGIGLGSPNQVTMRLRKARFIVGEPNTVKSVLEHKVSVRRNLGVAYVFFKCSKHVLPCVANT
jgi:hypothetical protein